MLLSFHDQEDIQSHEEKESKLQEQIQSFKAEIETQHGQLLASREQIQTLKQDKDAFYKGNITFLSGNFLLYS